MLLFKTFFVVLLLVLLLKLSITSKTLSRASFARFLARFFAALLVMIFAVAFFQAVTIFLWQTLSLYCLAGAPLYLLFIFVCGGNFDLGTLSYLATNVLPSGHQVELLVWVWLNFLCGSFITWLSFLLIFFSFFNIVLSNAGSNKDVATEINAPIGKLLPRSFTQPFLAYVVFSLCQKSFVFYYMSSYRVFLLLMVLILGNEFSKVAFFL